MSAGWNVTLGERTLDFTVPVIGLAAGVSLLLAIRPAAHRPASARPTPGAVSVPMALPEDDRARRLPTGSVSGVVLDAHGDPVPGARVFVVDGDGAVVAETTAAADPGHELGLGEFHVDQLPRGIYGLRATVDESRAQGRLGRFPVAAWEDTRVRVHINLGY